MKKRGMFVSNKHVMVVSVISLVLLLLSGCVLFNSPPVASFVMSPDTGVALVPVEFDASGSNDSDGSIISYEWDFGDGGNGTGVTVEHVFAAAGTYEITLTVTDDGGKSASVTQGITVEAGGSPPPPPPPPTG